MEINKIIIKHVIGIRSNQVDEFSFKDNDALTLGRSEDSMVRFDSDKEIGVSRNHATIKKGHFRTILCRGQQFHEWRTCQ